MRLFDLHCDTLFECMTKNKDLRENDLQISLERTNKFDKWCQVFAIWIPDTLRGENAVRHFDAAADYLYEQLERHSDRFMLLQNGRDIEAENGKAVAIFAVEGGAAAAGTIEGVRHLYERGVKLITLTWNGSNEIADGCGVSNAKGLTPFGFQAIEEMKRLKMIIDVSHLSDAAFNDVASVSDASFIASHSNSRRVCEHPRNLTDWQFEEIRDRGGIVGINFHSSFLAKEGRASFDDILRHIEHLLSLGGEKTVCLGSDFDGGIDPPEGLENIEKIEDLANFLLRHNYKESTVCDIFYDNAARFFINALT